MGGFRFRLAWGKLQPDCSADRPVTAHGGVCAADGWRVTMRLFKRAAAYAFLLQRLLHSYTEMLASKITQGSVVCGGG